MPTRRGQKSSPDTEAHCARRARLERLKEQIASGEYESEEKLEVALKRMLTDLRAAAKAANTSREGGSGDGCP